ncbi:MAG: hypothetical protein WCJ37_03655 [Syntrophus sp. (in: bacteria)]
MTLEERIARIENALIAADLMDPVPSANFEAAIEDLLKGDNTALYDYFLKNPDHWKQTGGRGRAKNNKSLSKGCGKQ